MKQDEKYLFSQLKSGDEKAFEYFFKTYFEQLYQYAFQITKEQFQSEEIVEDTFVMLWEKRKQIDLHGTSKSYLFRMVYNQCLNYFKHKKVGDKYKEFFLYHQPVSDFPDSFSGFPLETLINQEFQEILEQSIQKLPDQCRQIFTMSRLEGRKNKEIADLLGISVNTVKTQLLRGLKAVRTDLKDLIVLLYLKK
jgi:RNA polymerase sigma-70 factor (ECF subfamily)